MIHDIFIHEEDPTFNSTVKENSEQAAHTTGVVSSITTVTNSSLVSSTVSRYYTELTPRVYETIDKGFSSIVNQHRSAMNTGFSSNQNEARDKIFDSQNLNSQNSYYLRRAQSTMYHQSENSQLPYTPANLPDSAEHYTHYLY